MSQTIHITLPDGSVREYPRGITPLEVARSIGAGLAKAAIAAKLEGELIDLRLPLTANARLAIVTTKDPLANEVIRHSAEHVMADAVKQLWPDVQIDVGRTDHSDKFQYDFKMSRPFTPSDLEAIEKKMSEIISKADLFSRRVVSRDEAQQFFQQQGEHLKVDRLNDIPFDQDISLFSHGDFTDLCRGPHVQHAGQIGAIKLLETSASYWRGDEKNIVLQRIYGTAFSSKAELEAYERFVEESRQRDHRKIGKDLDLFSVSDEVGPGLILWHPKGSLIRHVIETYWKEQHLKAGYDLIYSPHLAKASMWETSGHTGFYKDNMFSPMDVEKTDYMIKPMNCPFHLQVYKSTLRSYRDLPLRYAELGTVYRYERSGVLHGLLRVRGFTQDDAHLFVHPDQLLDEISSVLDFMVAMFEKFGFKEYDIYLSTRPEKSVGTDEDWDRATAALKQGLEKKGLKYQVDPGEGVFYGPKIDIKIRDALGRSWQCATIQADFNLPARFSLEFVDRDGTKRAPVMVHRALLGSMERFFGVLVEHYMGAFPFWLAPTQVKIIPISEQQKTYAAELRTYLKSLGYRAVVDERSEKLGYKIREAQLEKVPLMFVVGAQEEAQRVINVRRRSGEQENIAWEAIHGFLKQEEEQVR